MLPRRFALLPLIVGGCYMTGGQVLIIGGLHFYFLRVLILFALARIIIRREVFTVRPNAIDWVLLAWLSVSSFLYLLFDGTNVTLVNRLGYAFDVAGTYALVRSSVRTKDDIVFIVKSCAVVVIPLGVLFVIEGVTGRNPFAGFGGVPVLSEVRDGRVRCQGPFEHAILAGTFGATLMPLFFGLWVNNKENRLLATCAIVAATAIVIASGSSGPLMAFGAAVAGLICWLFRNNMRLVRWGIGTAFVALIVAMKAPVWFVISRISDLTGGSGWYRSELIDSAIRHLDEWWLIGTGYTAHWMPTGISADPNSADIVNEFIAQGVRGGLLSLLLFVWMIVKCFKTVGSAVHETSDLNLGMRALIWTLGCGLVAHVASFFSVSYFDQMIIFWYLVVGMIAALSHRTGEVSVDRRASRPATPDALVSTKSHLAFGRTTSGESKSAFFQRRR
jgi:hypothetical protein